MLNPSLIQQRANDRVKKLQNEAEVVRQLDDSKIPMVQKLFKVVVAKRVFASNQMKEVYS